MFLAAPDANIQGFFSGARRSALKILARKSHFFDDFCARTKKNQFWAEISWFRKTVGAQSFRVFWELF